MPKKTRTTSLENIFVSETHRLIYTEISYLKKRIHLVEGERKANYESNEESLKKNEIKLRELRQTNQSLKSKRKLMLESKESFVKQIAAKLGGEKKAYEFKDKKFSYVLDIFECKIGTLRNKENSLKYTKSQQDIQMINIIEEEETLKTLMEGKEPHQKLAVIVKKRLNDIKMTETGVAAMAMKITEADNIRSRYKNMTTLLKSENFTLNIKVGELGRKLNSENLEIKRIKQVLQDSLKAKKLAKARLSEVGETTIKDYSEREQHLYESRMQLKLIREKMDQIGSKLSFPKFHMIHRDSSVAEGLYVGYQMTDDKRETKAQTLIETVYTELATMIGHSDPAIIVIKFQEQRDHSKELLAQEDAAKSAVRKAKLRARFLQDKLSQLQYSGGLRREKLNAKFSKISTEMSSTTSERDKLHNWLEAHHSAMEQMQTKLHEICQINDFKIPTFNTEIPAENVAKLLKFVLKQLEKVLGGSDGPMISPVTLSPSVYGIIDDKEMGYGGGIGAGGLLPFEINEEGSVFNLPSPVGSTASYRLGGSMSDIEMGLGPMDLGVEKLPFDLDFNRDRAPSIVVHSEHGQDLLARGLEDGNKRDDSAGIKIKEPGIRRGESSEEEEAVTRNVVKRQSQILFEAKTRKGRFNTGMTSNNARNRKY